MTDLATISLDIPVDATFDQWVSAGARLSDMHKHLGFMVGDWTNFGRERFPEQIEMAIERAGIDPKFAERAAQIARMFPQSVRAKGLSFEQHRAVAKLPKEDAVALLSTAERHHWELRELRDAVVKKRYEQGDIFDDEDRDYYLTREMIRAWNRGTPAARQAFADLVQASHLQTIDEDEVNDTDE